MDKKKTKKRKKHINISSDALAKIHADNEKRILNEDTAFDVVEAYKATRTNIMFSLNNETGCKKIVITSPTAGEGKTTTCINLAKVFAQNGVRVLVIDADLRAPRIHKYLKLENEFGLSNVLAGFKKLDECIRKDVSVNLDCITSGAVPPNPVELISANNMTRLLDDLEGKYDYVFIDTPPLNIVTEALVLSKLVTGVILVTRQKYTMYKMVERAINSLKFADAKILGFILNDADRFDSYGGYRSGRGYRYYSRYGRRYGRYGRYGRYSYYGSRSKANEQNFPLNIDVGGEVPPVPENKDKR